MFRIKRIASYCALFLSIVSFSVLSLCARPVEARDSNGVTVTDFSTGSLYGMHIDHYTAFDPDSATYVYNEAGGQTSSSGEVSLLGLSGPKTLVIYVPTLGSTSIDFRLEGKVGAMATWTEIYVENVTSAMTIGKCIPICEYFTAYRLGVKVNTDGEDLIYCTTSVVNPR